MDEPRTYPAIGGPRDGGPIEEINPSDGEIYYHETPFATHRYVYESDLGKWLHDEHEVMSRAAWVRFCVQCRGGSKGDCR